MNTDPRAETCPDCHTTHGPDDWQCPASGTELLIGDRT